MDPVPLLADDQYAIVAERRNSYNTLLWQTPGLAIAGQTFLLTISLDEASSTIVGLVVGFVGLGLGFAALYLFERLRFLELHDSVLLRTYEESRPTGEGRLAVVHGRPKPYRELVDRMGNKGRRRAYEVWRSCFWALIGLDAAAFAYRCVQLVAASG